MLVKVGTYLPMIYHVGDQPFTYSVFLCSALPLVLGRRPNPDHIAQMIDAEGVTALWAARPHGGGAGRGADRGARTSMRAA